MPMQKGQRRHTLKHERQKGRLDARAFKVGNKKPSAGQEFEVAALHMISAVMRVTSKLQFRAEEPRVHRFPSNDTSNM